MSSVNESMKGEVIALVLPAAGNRQIHIDHNAPLSEPRASTNSAIVRRSVLETVAIKFVSGPVSPKQTPILRARPDWPAMLTRAELCDYLGVSWSTLKGTLTVHPIDFGASVVRYSRAQIDDWIKTRPPRIKGGSGPLMEDVQGEPVRDERLTALERVRRRSDRR